jgi:hypothetical protein
MMLARLSLALATLAGPALSLAQVAGGGDPETAVGFGWAWALAVVALVVALFLIVFKRRPPIEKPRL